MAIASKVMDFLKETVTPFVQTGADVSNAIGNTEARIGTDVGLNPVGPMTNAQQFGGIPGVGGLASTPDSARQFASNAAQVGVSVLAPTIAKPAELAAMPLIRGAADVGEQAGGKLLGDVGAQVGKQVFKGAVKGAVGGSAVGAAGGVAQAVGTANNPKDLAMDFINGAASGAEQGGVFGMANVKGGATPNEASAVGGPIGQIARIFSNKLKARAGLVSDDNTIDGYNNSQDLVKDYADMISDSDKTAKGGMIQGNSDIGYTRGSEHSPFYRQTYAETGKAPTQQMWQDEAKRQLESGHGAYGASDTYSSLLSRESGGQTLDDQTAQDLANNSDTKQIEKQLTPKVGAVVAKDVAPAVAQANDPNIVKNIVDNDVQQKLQLGVQSTDTVTNPNTGETRDATEFEKMRAQELGVHPQEFVNQQQMQPQATQPLPAPTSTSDINTTQDVQAQEQALSQPQQPNPEEQSLNASGEQLASRETTAQSAPPSFMNAPGESGNSHVGTLGAVTTAHDMLNQGVPVESVVQQYMEQTNSSLKEAQDTVSNLVNNSSVDRSNVNSSLNPRKDEPSFAPTSSKEGAIINSKYAGSKVQAEAAPALKALQGLDEHDLELTRSLRGRNPAEVINQAHDPEAMAQAVSALKDYNDYTQAAGNKLGQDIPYRQNYGLYTPYDKPEETGTNSAQEPLQPGMANPTNAAYTKGRVFNTHEEAINNGYRPKNASALEDLQNDVAMRSRDQSRLALQKGLEDTYGADNVKRINGDQLPAGYHQLLIPNGDHLALPANIADKINTRQMYKYTEGKTGTAMKVYDAGNSIGKESELGGGTFHGFNTLGSFTGDQLLSGNLFKDPAALGKVSKNFFSQGATDKYFENLDNIPSGGIDQTHSVLDGMKASGYDPSKLGQDVPIPGEKGIAGKFAELPGLKQIHEAVFKREIPTMLAEQFRQKTQGLDIFGNAADREKAITIMKSINKPLGTIDHDIDGLTPKQFKVAGRVLLAPGYQEGQMMALYDALTKGGVEGQIARQSVFGKALLFGGLATLGAAAGGNFQGQTPTQVALSIMHKMVNPQFDIAGYNVSTPATPISEIGKPINKLVSSVKGGKNVGQGIASGVEDFANSRAAFLPAQAEELATNQNYEGNAIHGSDYFGRPINAAHDVLNEAEDVSPIPISNAGQVASGQENIGAALANTAGLSTSPQYNLNYAPIAGQTYVQQLEQTPGVPKAQIASDTQFFDLLEQGSKSKTKVTDNAIKAIAAKNPAKAQQLVDNYNQQLVATLTPWIKSGGNQYFDATMSSLLRSAELTYKKANENVSYDVQSNPTAYGVPIQALASSPTSTNQ